MQHGLQIITSEIHSLKALQPCDLVSPLKYFTVLTRSSRVASSSHTKTVCGCCWNADTVHMWFTPSSIALYKAKALCAPVMRIMTWKEIENVTCGLRDSARATCNLPFFGASGRWQAHWAMHCSATGRKFLTEENDNPLHGIFEIMQKHEATEAKHRTQKQDRLLIWTSHLFCVHDGAHSHGQSHGGHLWEIPIKESGVSHDSVLRQGLHPSPGNQAWTRLVEGNVAIGSNTWQNRRSSLNFTATSTKTARSFDTRVGLSAHKSEMSS